jgi:hypothetical protein
MANLYYNTAVDSAWDTLGNWWNDDAFTDPALAIPANGDTVYLAAEMTSGPSTSVTLNHIYVVDSNVDFSGAIGNATFSGNCYNYSIAIGDATFNDNSINYLGTVIGDATFNNDSSNGTLGPNATVIGNATFNDNSKNDGSGVVTGDATFRDSSRNLGTIEGDATVYYDGGGGEKPIGGFVIGSVTYIGWIYGVYYNNATEDGAWDTIGNWWEDSSFSILATLLPINDQDVYLCQTMLSGPTTAVTLNHIYVTGGAFSVNFTNAEGNATFRDSTYNLGTVTGDATFSLTAAVSQIKNTSGATNGTFSGDVVISGGSGSDQTIARLLDFPWFINL